MPISFENVRGHLTETMRTENEKMLTEIVAERSLRSVPSQFRTVGSYRVEATLVQLSNGIETIYPVNCIGVNNPSLYNPTERLVALTFLQPVMRKYRPTFDHKNNVRYIMVPEWLLKREEN